MSKCELGALGACTSGGTRRVERSLYSFATRRISVCESALAPPPTPSAPSGAKGGTPSTVTRCTLLQ
eukprot:1181912-Prorocentrum_minimum.AAC.2